MITNEQVRNTFSWKNVTTLLRKLQQTSKRRIAKTFLPIFMVLFAITSSAKAMSKQHSSSSSTTISQNTDTSTHSTSTANREKVVVEIVADHKQHSSKAKEVTSPKMTESFQSLYGYERGAVEEVEKSLTRLASSLEGVKLDSLIMLLANSAVVPIFTSLKLSPIIGFLLTGTLLGPYGLNWVKDLHLIDVLGELGIVIFLFEMGLELSIDRLKAMRKDVFGLGSSQFLVTSAVGALAAKSFGLSNPAAVTIGGSLALSSSAFVLQLLKDKNAMGTRHGKASFGILLLQDLAVVPLLVVVELLAEGGAGLGRALSVAGVKAMVTLATLSFLGRKLLNPIFSQVAKSRSQEAFLSVIFTTVFAMSFVTHGIGLSDTLGAFLAGILLSETSYRYQIEADIAPFRGLLLGFFFIKVGFSIDMMLILKEIKTISLLLTALITGKAAIITLLSIAFGVPLASAQQTGLLNSQGGEFAFVALGLAEAAGLLSPKLSKLLLTTVALSMAATPALSELGATIAKKIENNMGLTHYIGKDSDAVEVQSENQPNNFVVIIGYGKVGKLICDMLDRKFIRYIVLENSPQKAIEARNKGLPVFYGKSFQV